MNLHENNVVQLWRKAEAHARNATAHRIIDTRGGDVGELLQRFDAAEDGRVFEVFGNETATGGMNNVVRFPFSVTMKSNETPVVASAPSNTKHKVTYA